MRIPLYILVFTVLTSYGCGTPEPDSTPVRDAAVIDANAGDVGGEVDEGPQFVCPNEGEKVCDGKCVDVTISLEHCGTCFNSCQAGKMTCGGDDCICLGGRSMCGGRCFDAATSREHCGECDNTCRSTETCSQGACVEISDDPVALGVLSATNAGRAERQDCGVNGMKAPVDGVALNAQLNAAAQAHAEDMAANNFMAHEGSDGSSPGQRASRAGYSGSTGENVARGYDTPEAVVAGWIASDGHCKNLMEGAFTEMGVGFAVNSSTGEEFWAQLFGHP